MVPVHEAGAAASVLHAYALATELTLAWDNAAWCRLLDLAGSATRWSPTLIAPVGPGSASRLTAATWHPASAHTAADSSRCIPVALLPGMLGRSTSNSPAAARTAAPDERRHPPPRLDPGKSAAMSSVGFVWPRPCPAFGHGTEVRLTGPQSPAGVPGYRLLSPETAQYIHPSGHPGHARGIFTRARVAVGLETPRPVT